MKNLNQEIYGADLDRIKYLFGKEFEQGSEGIVRRDSKGLTNQKGDVKPIPGRKTEYEPDWEENNVTAGDVAYSDEGHQRSMAFYAEGSGPDFSLIDAAFDKNIEISGTNLSLVDGEVGVLSWDGEYEHGSFDIDLLNLEGDVGLSLAEKNGGIYAKGSVVDISGDVKIPIPFTDKELEIGVGVDFLTLGGGIKVDADWDEGKPRLEIGFHPGIFGGDVSAGFE